MTTTRGTRSAGRAAALVTTFGLVAGSAALLAAPAGAEPGPNDRTGTFAATQATLGTVPDAGSAESSPCVSATPGVREVALPVSGVTTPVTDVRVRLGLAADHVGSLTVQLVAPDGTTATLADRIGRSGQVPCGDASPVGGTFSFYDGAPGNLAVYAASTEGKLGTLSSVALRSGDNAVSLTNPFRGRAADGTWRLRITDWQATASGEDVDLASVYSAALVVSSTSPASTAACKTATAAAAASLAAAKSARATLTRKVKKVRKTRVLVREGLRAEKALSKAKRKKKKAKKAYAAAVAASQASAAVRKSSCT